MPSFSASAPGKIILFGEHAVVYGQPAIAVPVHQIQVKAIITPNPRGLPGSIQITAPMINLEADLSELPAEHPIAAIIDGVLKALKIPRAPACKLRITSTIPVAAGLGSGAAVSIAVTRALSAFLGQPLPLEKVSSIAFEVEKIHHGTPSGIDNTVITYSMPIYFKRGKPIETIKLKAPFTLVIADTGISSPTAVAVGDLHQAWQAKPNLYDLLFESVGDIVDSAKQAIENGHVEELGPLMDLNHELLVKMKVSSPQLDHLVRIAVACGALGAKLSGAGRGGNMIALVKESKANSVAQALLNAGATRTITTTVRI